MSKKIMIIAGEASGDLYGGQLVKALFEKDPNLEIFGVGGDNMKSAGMELFYHVDQMAIIGFIEVVKHFRFIKNVFYHLLAVLKKRKPDIVVLIDYPGFNLRFAKKAKKHGAKIFYFIAPQVWAWGQGRAPKMAKYIDKMGVIFDFEVPFFSKFGLDTEFVGHPLVEKLKTVKTRQEFFNDETLDMEKPLLGLFPGSRKQEIEKLLPAMLQTAQTIKSKHPNIQVAVSKAPTISLQHLNQFLNTFPDVKIISGETYDLMKYSSAAIVTSGTATLEMACWHTPYIIIYRVSTLSYLIGKKVIKIKNIGLANVVAGKELVKEFIQHDAVPEKMAPEVEKLLFDAKYREDLVSSLKTINQKLGSAGAIKRTSEIIINML